MNDDELRDRQYLAALVRHQGGAAERAFRGLLDEIGKQTAIADAFRKGGPAAVEEVRAQLGAQIESLQVENAALRAELATHKTGLDEICVWKDGVWTHSAACGRGAP